MKVYTIVVAYNGEHCIARCLHSLRNSTLKSKVIVIDNASSDDTLNLIKTNFQDVELIPQNSNLGFGAANNIGVRIALKDNADYVFLLNQDAYLESDTLENLIEIASENPDIGILTPVQDYAPGVPERYFTMFLNTGKSKYPAVHNLQPVDFIDAAVWLIPIAVVKKVGLFSPLFYHYGEDDNYCDRVLFYNYRICVAMTQVAYHETRQEVTFPRGHLIYLISRFRLKLRTYLANPCSSIKSETHRLINEIWNEPVRGVLKGILYRMIVIAVVLCDLAIDFGKISRFRLLSKKEGAFI
jgi:Predicted glycosyltransferases